MKTSVASLLFIALFFSSTTIASAQCSFGMKSSVADADAYPKVSIPAKTLAQIVEYSDDQISLKDFCLTKETEGSFSGYQADYDGDGTEEMWMLYHSGPKEEGCNVLVILSPIGGGKYSLMDLLSFPGGQAHIRPIVTLDKGVQMYLQNKRQIKEGVTEVKGAILGYQQTALIILTSWTQYDGMVDGKRVVEKADVVFTDINFDNMKEMIVRYSIHEPGGGKLTSKNMVDRYILTLDFLPNHLRYGVYDSIGYAEIQQAETNAQIGRRKLNRDETRIEGIIDIHNALEKNPFMTITRVRLGEFLLHDGKYGDAEKTLLQAAVFDPDYSKTYRILGDSYLRLNDLQKCLAAYTTYLELGPESTYYRKKVEANVKKITVPRKSR